MAARALLLLLAVGVLAGCGAGAKRAQQLSHDDLTDPRTQHETAVEPDSFAAGNTVVAVFQVGRSPRGGASAIGWATSTDAGKSWTSGLLEKRFALVSDPVVAYDRAHRVWLASSIGIKQTKTQGAPTSIAVNRSTDGSHWGRPVVVARGEAGVFNDKDWLVCDRHGRCYAIWTRSAALGDMRTGIADSADGGRTWSTPRVLDLSGFAYQPLAAPDDSITLVYLDGNRIEARRSTDGLRTVSPPVTVGSIRSHLIRRVRTPVLPAAAAANDGRSYVVWRDCRFSAHCAREGLVFAASDDGTHWSATQRIPVGTDDATLPALAVDGHRLAVMFTTLHAASVATYVVTSDDAGRTWSAPRALSKPMPIDAFPRVGPVRFLGDYDAISFVGGVPVGVYADASKTFDGRFHEGIWASSGR